MKNPEILSQFAPKAQFRSSVSLTTHVSPEIVMRALQRVSLKDIPLALWLGRLRYLPARLRGRAPSDGELDQSFIQLLLRKGTLVLARSPLFIVLGAAGKYHKLTDQEFKIMASPEALQSFNDPGYQKLYIHVQAEAVLSHLTRVTLEHWTYALSESSRRRFARYWIVIRPMGNLLAKLLLQAAIRRATEVLQGKAIPMRRRSTR